MRDALESHLLSPACTEDFNESLRTPNFLPPALQWTFVPCAINQIVIQLEFLLAFTQSALVSGDGDRYVFGTLGRR